MIANIAPLADARVINQLAAMLEKSTGQVLLPNRHWRIESALKPVMGRHSIPDFSVLAEILDVGEDKGLETECLEAMLNNETSFFRDQPNFAVLTGPVLDHVRAVKSARKHIRILCNACSTGQEPYSLAMTFADNAEKWRGWVVEIIAVDISTSALQKARTALYSQFEIQRGLPVLLMLRHFDQIDTQWQLKDTIRKMVSFRHANALDSMTGMGKFDIILCRNMLMYLGEEARHKVLDNMADVAHAESIMMLGAAETVIGQTERFAASRDFRGFFEVPAKAQRLPLRDLRQAC
jgi:chemotaxis protein methyltransferase CheR